MLRREGRARYEWRLGRPTARGEVRQAAEALSPQRGATEAAEAASQAHLTTFGQQFDIASLHAETATDVPSTRAAPAMSMVEALRTFGFPQPVTETTPDQDLINLLINAAEIEQGLMIQYLFAASTAGNTDVAEYLSTLAVEEMGHFLTVQNLLVAFGAEPHLQHSDWVETDIFKPFEFRLEQASKPSVAKYALAEMPDPNSAALDATQRSLMPDILAAAELSGGQDLASHRVGLLYMKIYWLLRANDEPLPNGEAEPWEGFPVADAAAEAPRQHISDGLFRTERLFRLGLLDNWTAPGRDLKVRRLGSRWDALLAVADLSAQGEGFGSSGDGHFDKLVRAWQLPDAQYPAAGAFATNPWYEEEATEEADRAGDEITNPVSLAFARMGDRAYEVVVLTIALSLLLPEGTGEDARALIGPASITCMKSCLLPCIKLLGRTPVSADSAAPRKLAGLPYMQTPLVAPGNAASVRERIRVLKDEINAIVAEVQQLAAASILVKNVAKSIAGKLATDVWSPIEQTVA